MDKIEEYLENIKELDIKRNNKEEELNEYINSIFAGKTYRYNDYGFVEVINAYYDGWIRLDVLLVDHNSRTLSRIGMIGNEANCIKITKEEFDQELRNFVNSKINKLLDNMSNLPKEIKEEYYKK